MLSKVQMLGICSPASYVVSFIHAKSVQYQSGNVSHLLIIHFAQVRQDKKKKIEGIYFVTQDEIQLK